MNDYIIKDIEKIIHSHQPEIIKTDRGNVVVLNKEDYKHTPL